MNEKLLEVILKELNLKLGEEFKLEGKDNFYFKFTTNGIMFKNVILTNKWEITNLTMNNLLNRKIIKIPYKERIKEGDIYYFVTPLTNWGFGKNIYFNNETTKLLFERIEIYETEEEVKEEIKKLGWNTSC